jgi:APA family basic amino acid/polyamine antiporter
VPAFYVLAAVAIMVVLLLYKTATTWPGLVLVLTGFPVYFFWRRRAAGSRPAA